MYNLYGVIVFGLNAVYESAHKIGPPVCFVTFFRRREARFFVAFVRRRKGVQTHLFYYYGQRRFCKLGKNFVFAAFAHGKRLNVCAFGYIFFRIVGIQA